MTGAVRLSRGAQARPDRYREISPPAGVVCYEKKYGHACIKASIALFLLTFCALAGNRGGFTGVSPFRPGGGVWGGGSEIFLDFFP